MYLCVCVCVCIMYLCVLCICVYYVSVCVMYLCVCVCVCIMYLCVMYLCVMYMCLCVHMCIIMLNMCFGCVNCVCPLVCPFRFFISSPPSHLFFLTPKSCQPDGSVAAIDEPWMPVQEVCAGCTGMGASAPDALLPGVWKPSSCEWVWPTQVGTFTMRCSALLPIPHRLKDGCDFVCRTTPRSPRGYVSVR